MQTRPLNESVRAGPLGLWAAASPFLLLYRGWEKILYRKAPISHKS